MSFLSSCSEAARASPKKGGGNKTPRNPRFRTTAPDRYRPQSGKASAFTVGMRQRREDSWPSKLERGSLPLWPRSQATCSSSWRLRDQSQKGYLERRVRSPVSRSGHPQGVLVPDPQGQEPKRNSPTGPPGHLSKALEAWLTGMKPLENCLFTLPLQGKFDVSPRANSLQGKPLQSFWNWPCRSCSWKPQVSTPSRCSSRKQNPRKAVKTSSLQLCTSSRRVRKAL